MEKNVFLSHASEDKEFIVKPFAKNLDKYGITYWLDMNEIVPGDLLLEKIFSEGIAKSDYVVVFISRNFLKKGWANAELRNALAKQVRTNTKFVIPFLVDINFIDLLKIYPEFENIFCGDLKNGLEHAAFQLSKIINEKSISNKSLFRRYEILSILNWYNNDIIEYLDKISFDELLSKVNSNNMELMYAFALANYSDKQLHDFVMNRLESNSIPTDSFFLLSIVLDTTWKDKNAIASNVLRRYPSPQPYDYLSINLPHKEVSFFKEVNAGSFVFGAEESDEFRKEWISKPVHIYLDDYSISSTPITNYMYELFSKEHVANRLTAVKNSDSHPVVNVSWYDSVMYTIWLSQLIKGVSLPTEFEWEKAASWSDYKMKTIFPWGNEWKRDVCNSWYDKKQIATSPVGMFENGKSAYGVYDMSGNVWEWCSDWFSEDWSKYFKENLTSNPLGPMIGNRKVDRGGGWYRDVGVPTVYMRAGDRITDRFTHCGFRIVKRRSENG